MRRDVAENPACITALLQPSQNLYTAIKHDIVDH